MNDPTPTPPPPRPPVAAPAAHPAHHLPASHPWVRAEVDREARRRAYLRSNRPGLFRLVPIVALVDAPAFSAARSLRDRLAPGSVVVAVPTETPDVYTLDYEGGISSRQGRDPTPQERREYALIAAGRGLERAPTVARAYAIPAGDLVQVGEINVGEGHVAFFDAPRPLPRMPADAGICGEMRAGPVPPITDEMLRQRYGEIRDP